MTASKTKQRYGKNHRWVKRTRLELTMKQGNRCYWCKEYMTVPQSGTTQRPTDATLDHVVPRADGGSKKLSNLVAACAKCNNERPSKALLKHNAEMQEEARAKKQGTV